MHHALSKVVLSKVAKKQTFYYPSHAYTLIIIVMMSFPLHIHWAFGIFHLDLRWYTSCIQCGWSTLTKITLVTYTFPPELAWWRIPRLIKCLGWESVGCLPYSTSNWPASREKKLKRKKTLADIFHKLFHKLVCVHGKKSADCTHIRLFKTRWQI